MNSLWISIRMTVVLTVLTGIIYPIVMTVAANVIFPNQAGGSLVERDGKVVGSSLLGQNFSQPGYFHPRPSAAGNNGYDATSSSGSNAGPTSKALIDSVHGRLKDLLASNPGLKASDVPVDLVTASGSGLDSEISPAGAEIQVPRIAHARGLTEDQVRELVRQNTRSRWAGILGEPGVNVLMLNLALDQMATGKGTSR
ncbi:MAG TPA: potassium-transporting ATPase subunit KdpC [Candidatus Binataceae bacterium]|nr:potassium-transporting ATPase subunit KdpC [Candidatus Binataceae bacterium]